jgi:hypothetical protein
VTFTSIGSLEPRRRATVAGDVRSVRSYQRPHVRTEVEVEDGTGVIVLRFLGRSRVPGIKPGLPMVAHGTPGRERDALVMLNPLYCFAGV